MKIQFTFPIFHSSSASWSSRSKLADESDLETLESFLDSLESLSDSFLDSLESLSDFLWLSHRQTNKPTKRKIKRQRMLTEKNIQLTTLIITKARVFLSLGLREYEFESWGRREEKNKIKNVFHQFFLIFFAFKK